MKKNYGQIKNNLSKIFSLIMAFALIITLAACSGGEKESENNEGATSETKDIVSEIKERGVLYMGTSPDFPPNEFYYLDENNQKQIEGYDVRLAQAIADELGVELEVKATDFNGVLANIQSEQVDMGIAGFTVTEKRKESMQFSDGYNTTTSEGFQGILMKKDMAKKFETLDDIKAAKLKFGAQGGSIQYELALKLTDADKIVQRDTMDSLALALDAGDIDAVTVSTDSTAPMLKTFPDFMILPQDNFDLDPENVYSTNVIGFPLGEHYQPLIDLSNDVIKKLKADGTIEKWIEECKEISEKNTTVE